MTSLVKEFFTGNTGIAYLISGVDLGRLVSILFLGVLSGKFGCRVITLPGTILCILFFFGIPTSPNLMIAFILAAYTGMANSALDTDGYPALTECLPKASDSAVILVRAMVSFGQMIYPVVVSIMLLNHIWCDYAVIIPGALLVVITLMLLKSRFPSRTVDAGTAKDLPQMNSKPLVWLEGTTSVTFGVAASPTFYVIVVWMPKYTMAFAGIAKSDALKTISYYSIDSLVCVFISVVLLKKWVRPIWANIFNAGLVTITTAVIYSYPSPLACNAGSFLAGLSAVNGILRLGISMIPKLFPESKAKVTSIYMMVDGVANFITSLITRYLPNIGLQYIILLDLAFTLLAFVTAIIVSIHYYCVFGIPKNDVRLGERYFQ